MDISLQWLNAYLEPGDVSAQEADDLLTQAGLPIEEHTPLAGGDVLMDVEVTSNRPDCLSHLGCAREVAALSERALKYPEPGAVESSGAVGVRLAVHAWMPPMIVTQVYGPMSCSSVGSTYG